MNPLATNLCGIALRNPVIAASGTFGYGLEFASILDLSQLGALVTKGLTANPSPVMPLHASGTPKQA